MVNKELEAQGCKTFVCPSLCMIDEKGKELQLRDTTIKRAKDIAIEYFKKTYHRPHYQSAKRLLPSFIYIASILEGERISQHDILCKTDVSGKTVTKWSRDIIDTLCIKIIYDGRGFILEGPIIENRGIETIRKDIDLNLIDIEGKALGLRDDTIEKAKELVIMYIDPHKVGFSTHRYVPQMERIYSATLYIASIIKDDRRTLAEISRTFNVPISVIGKVRTDIEHALDIKIQEEYTCLDLSPLDEGGKALGLREDTIKKAKELAVMYVNTIYRTDTYMPRIEQIFPAVIRIVSITENDIRTYQDISTIFNISKHAIWMVCRNIDCALGIGIL